MLESLNLYARLDKPHPHSLIDDPTRLDEVFERARRGAEKALAMPTIVYGHRTQAMFQGMVAALGAVRLLKVEDSGDCYYSGPDLKVPDYRLVTAEDTRFLVEVKNFHRDDPTAEFTISRGEVAGLRRYAALAGDFEVRLAIYWSGWNLWTLIAPDDLRPSGERLTISLPEASKVNELAMLGDFIVGTRWPLTCILRADPASGLVDETGEAIFRIASVELQCAGEALSEDLEQQIAMFLLMYGAWEEEETTEVVDGRLAALRFDARPAVLPDGQGFAMVGPLSSMYAAWFRSATEDTTGTTALTHDAEPAALGRLIPNDYESDRLPIWCFHLVPNRAS